MVIGRVVAGNLNQLPTVRLYSLCFASPSCVAISVLLRGGFKQFVYS